MECWYPFRLFTFFSDFICCSNDFDLSIISSKISLLSFFFLFWSIVSSSSSSFDYINVLSFSFSFSISSFDDINVFSFSFSFLSFWLLDFSVLSVKIVSNKSLNKFFLFRGVPSFLSFLHFLFRLICLNVF